MQQSRIGIWSVRSQANDLATVLAERLSAHHVTERLSDLSDRETFVQMFHKYEQWVLIMTTGIASRYLQGLLKSKKEDPSVVVLDEAARFAISFCGGHEGGGNDLTVRVANATGALPVITTATEALKPLVVGIGCRKGISEQVVHAAVTKALSHINRNIDEVRHVATVDVKAHEKGLVEWTRNNQLPLLVVSRDEIKNRPWMMKPSAWVQKNIGVEGVCEPVALLSSQSGGLVLPKFVHEGVTVAIVEERLKKYMS